MYSPSARGERADGLSARDDVAGIEGALDGFECGDEPGSVIDREEGPVDDDASERDDPLGG
jgi:hypothetical protein